MPPPVALTIAGSDPSGGAGLQADLKTFAALGVYGMTVLTIATDCATDEGVQEVHAIPPAFVARQIERVCRDIPPHAVKTGMLYDEAVIEVVAEAARRFAFPAFVLDPVMTTRRAERLLSDGAEHALLERLLPLATVVTPSLPEAERLTGLRVRSREAMERAAEAVLALGPRAVVVKGGHLDDDPIAPDFFYDGREGRWLEAARVPRVMHGAGDTFAAAITAVLAQGRPLREAVEEAKHYVTGAILHAPTLGRGNGPLAHAWRALGMHASAGTAARNPNQR